MDGALLLKGVDVRVLPINRICNVVQALMIERALVPKDVYEAREKAETEIEHLLRGTVVPDEDARWAHLDAEDRALVMSGGQREEIPWQHLGEAQPPTLPTSDEANPFPMLEPPMG